MMISGLKDQHGGYGMTLKTAGSVVSRLRTWLVGGSLGAVAMLLPTTAQAKEYHHKAHISHHLSHHVGEHINQAAYRHDDHRARVDRVIKVDYRTDHHRDLLRHDRDAHYGQDAHLIRADYRTDRRHHEYRPSLHHRNDYDQCITPRLSYSRLQCVPYAREVSHIELSGDAFLWWAEAAGRYGRGYQPAVGSVLNFRATGRMPLGHVAVVTAVLGSRTILVTQANWVPGTITNDVTVEDVSPENNWSQVRVEYGNEDVMGSTYPTYGFIYDHAATAATIYASNAGGRDEVAEAPAVRAISTEAPNRNLR